MQLSTAQDLSTYGQEYGAVIRVIVSLCTRGSVDRRRQVFSSSLLNANDVRVGYARPTGAAEEPDRRGRHVYRLYLHFETPAWQPHVTRDDDVFVRHDLRRQNDDLCLQVFSGLPILIPASRSEVVVIPYPLVAAALARAGLPHAAAP